MNKEPISRLSIDLQMSQHINLKKRSAERGISMREYILEALAEKESREEKQEVYADNESFRKALREAKKEHRTLIKNLSKR